MFLNTNSATSRYRHCMRAADFVDASTLMPALKVRSTTLPVVTFFSLVRTNAGPLPGLTCWNSTTVHRPWSRFKVMPFFKSFVVATFPVSRSKNEQVSGRRREQARPVGSHDQDVLDPDSAPAGQVDARLDGNRDPGGKFTRPGVPDRRGLVHLQ